MKLNKKITTISTLSLILASMSNINANASSLYDDKIHFLPVGGSDAILIESNGKFALVDGGEDSDNPRGFAELNLKGYENVVVDYIKKVAGDKNGNVELEFIVGTHAHSDHLGGLDTVINDPKITVKKGYIKKYDESKIVDTEVNEWDNKEVYEQTINALKKENATIVQNISKEPFKFGDFTLQFFNTEYDTDNTKKGENENSLGLKIIKGNQSAFLAGDINNEDGDEDKIAKEVGKVDLLKLGHHGLFGSSGPNFLNVLRPTYNVVTTYEDCMHPFVVSNLNNINSKSYSTMTNNGVIATFGYSDFGLKNYSDNKKWVYENNQWYYKNTKNEATKGWSQLYYKDKTNWYYFDNSGVMQKGWVNLNNKWYYLNDKTDNAGYEGAMLIGWQQVNYNGKTDWYYFDNSGAMQTGWINLNDKWYYLNDKTNVNGYQGSMLIGWQQINYNGKTDWYYFDNSGAMKTGWVNLNNKWYYLNDKTDNAGYQGAMLTGKHYLEWNGKYAYYTFNNSGELI